MMKSTILRTILVLSILVSISKAYGSDDQYLGKCDSEQGDFLVYKNQEQHSLKFKIATPEGEKEVVFDRNLVRLWYNDGNGYWIFRNGRHNGIFSWNFDTGYGHLKYVNGDYNYWNLTNCNINAREVTD
ncbi:MAG: hypothetical protein ACM3MG_00120 [Bacillota bacterium]